MLFGRKNKVDNRKKRIQKYYRQFISNSNNERILIILKKDSSLNIKLLFFVLFNTVINFYFFTFKVILNLFKYET